MKNNMKTGTLKSGESERKANVSCYLERKSATVLMVIKLAEALGKLCLTIVGAFMLQQVVTALNRIFQEGTTVSDGKAMVAQVLKTLQVPPETIKQVIDAFPLDIRFSSGPVVFVFVLCMPFVVIAILEAIAAIRLRLGKGGTGTISILQRIYYVLGVIFVLASALVAIALSIFTIFRLGGTIGIAVSTVYVSLAIFYILISAPTLFYHRNVAMIMDEIGYEMETGKQAVHKHFLFKENLIVLLVLEVIGIIVSLIASWRPQQGGIAAAMLVASLIGPLAKLLKYLCMKYCYKNYIKADNAEETEGVFSHIPQFVLIIIVTLIFVVPIIFVCRQSSSFSNAVVEKVEEFVGNARQTVDEVSTVAGAQIEAVQNAMGVQTQTGTVGTVEAPQSGTETAAVETAAAAQDETKAESAAASDAAKSEKKAESAVTSDAAKSEKKKKSSKTN